MMDNFFRRMEELINGGEDNYDPIGPLTPEDSEEWDKINLELNELRSRMREIDARKTLFWTRLERKLGIYDKSLKIDNGMVLVQKENSKKITNPFSSFFEGCGGDGPEIP